jgi:hypothetical protein
MITVRLFLSQKPSGFVGFDDTGHRMRPPGILSEDSVHAIRRELETGCVVGWVCGYNWYRQATPYCPLDAALAVGNVTKACPCEDEPCGLDALS